MLKQNIFYKTGDKVVYPAHGVGEINSVKVRNIGGAEHRFYEITILESGMRIMRPVVDRNAVTKIYRILKQRNVRVDTQTWNRRYRLYTQKIKTGSVFEMAEVLRDLCVLGKDKELSFGEKKMMDTVKDLLVTEISIAKSREQDKVRLELADICATA